MYKYRIYVRKGFWEKNLEIKTLEMKSEFSQVLGKNISGFLGLFFPKIVRGLPIKSQEIRFQEKKS